MRNASFYSILIATAFLFSPLASQAQSQTPSTCDAKALSTVIDTTAATLRQLNRESEKRFQDRLQAIARDKKWTPAERASKANEAVDDRHLSAFNTEIEELVSKLDALSIVPSSGEITCARLDELKTVRERLVAVMTQKSNAVIAQLETASGGFEPHTTAAPQTTVAAGASVEQKQQEPKQHTLADAPLPTHKPNAAPPQQDQAWAANVARSLSQNQQPQATAQTSQSLSPSQATTAQQKQLASLPPAKEQPDNLQAPVLQADPTTLTPRQTAPKLEGYTEQEIREAGRGVFGTLTSEFAVIVSHAFQEYGEPNGYILGDEGGGAFLAGLRYGEGQLYARVNGVEMSPTRIYWQGPSLGVDVGAAGSRTLFLVYSLDDVSNLYKRFSGIDGTAYVAGGFGLTVLGNGHTVVVPIRTGLGLRLGASLGYLKFTERQSLNPF